MALLPPGVRIEVEDGISTVFVNEDNLKDFPTFMKSIVENSIGKDQGFFKISIEGDVVSSSIEELVDFIKNFFCPDGKRKLNCELVRLQTIFKSSSSTLEHVYGLRHDIQSKGKTLKKRDEFLRSAFDVRTYANQATCCLQEVGDSVTNAMDQFWETIRNNDACNPIFYAAGIPLEQQVFHISRDFSLSKLNTILDLLEERIPGIAYPYLYVGGQNSSFPWHIEDGAAFSINYLHYGAPCIWSFVSPKNYKQFESSCRFFPLDPAQVTCCNPLGHKYIMASPDYLKTFDIPVKTVIQREKDLLVIYPFTPHSGFRTGYSISEAANFGDPSWVELGILAPSCLCFTCNFKMDMTPLIKETKPHLLELYTKNNMGGMLALLKDNEYIKELGILPSLNGTLKDDMAKEAFTNAPVMEDVPVNLEDLQSKRTMEQSSHVKNTDREDDAAEKKERLILKCPECNQTYKGGIGRMDRLIKHINQNHEGSPALLDQLTLLYPKKMTTKGLLCLECGQIIAGNMFHLKLHMKRKHFKN